MKNIEYVQFDIWNTEYKQQAQKLLAMGYMYNGIDRSELPQMLIFVWPFTPDMKRKAMHQRSTGILRIQNDYIEIYR